MMHATAWFLLLSFPAIAQEPTPQQLAPQQLAIQQDSAVPSTNAKDGKALRRVVRLKDGRTLQTIARKRAGHWEVRRGRDYSPLPEGSVRSVALESDLLRSWKAAELPDDASAKQRTAHVRAGLEAGLLSQGLKALEALLVEHPISSAPVALVAEHAGSIRRPKLQAGAEHSQKQLDEVASWGASRGALAAELAIIELAKVKDSKGVQTQLAQWLSEGSPQRRAFAAHGLRRLGARQQSRPLMRHAVLDGSETVRTQASLALAAAGEEALVIPIARALNSSHPSVRMRAATSLGLMAYPAAVEPLVARLARAGGGPSRPTPHSNIFVGTQMAYVQDFDVEVAQGSAVADPSINVLISGSVLDVGVIDIEIQQVARQERRGLVKSLRRLTGANPGSSPDAWSRWYAGQQAKSAGDSGSGSKR
ncbi:MAG: hypothetical protein ACI8QC_001800 [Planctomycetota bacterium]|jgi:hypothetical protein